MDEGLSVWSERERPRLEFLSLALLFGRPAWLVQVVASLLVSDTLGSCSMMTPAHGEGNERNEITLESTSTLPPRYHRYGSPTSTPPVHRRHHLSLRPNYRSPIMFAPMILPPLTLPLPRITNDLHLNPHATGKGGADLYIPPRRRT